MITIGNLESPCAQLAALRSQGITLPGGAQAQLEALCAQERASTPFSAPATLAKHSGLAGGVVALAPDAACKGLQSRITKYGPLDPQPQIRQILLEKCEAYQKTLGSGVRATNPDEQPQGGLDTKTKIAIGVGALVLGAIVLKKLKKR